MAELLTAAIENVDGDHWVGFPMTLLEGGNHSFCTDTTQNQMAFDQDDCDLKDPKFFESGARQRGFIQLSERLAVHEPDAKGILRIQEIENDREWLSDKAIEFPEATTLLCIKVRGFAGRHYKCPLFRSRYEALAKTVLLLGQWERVGDLAHMSERPVITNMMAS